MTELKSRMGIAGKLDLRLYGPDGKIKVERFDVNTVTEGGDAHVADAMSDQNDAPLGYMAVGTGSGQSTANSGLATSLDINALDSTTLGVGVADNDVIYVCTWSAGDGTGAITEAGIFMGNDNGSMNYYADFAVINKAAADSLVITWTVTFGAS